MNNSKQLNHVFIGFGFGPIQAGFFIHEAVKSGVFSRVVVAEVDDQLVTAVRANKGCYCINIARKNGIESLRIEGVEIFNSTVDEDNKTLRKALASATEIVTSLPSVAFYTAGGNNSIASLIADGFTNSKDVLSTFVYAAENNNYAAEILEKAVDEALDTPPRHFVQYINTVIGKMSQIVSEPEKINRLKLKPIAPGLDRAFLVEEFDRILINRNKILGFKVGG